MNSFLFESDLAKSKNGYSNVLPITVVALIQNLNGYRGLVISL
jgi:hypothetical protein